MDNQFNLTDLLNAMHDLGFMFFPIWPNTKDPACSSWKKIEHHMSPVDVIARIKKGSNYAMIPPESVFVIDFDSDDAYQRGIEKASIIADSLTFKTPKGYHVLFVGDGVPQTASPIKEDPKKPRSPKTFLGKGVDVRVGGTVDSAKGYIVGPGSTRDGKRYEYLSGDEILDAPAELISLLQKPKTWKEVTGQDSPVDAPTAPTTPPDSATGNTRPLTIQERGKAAKKHWQALEDAQEGERNDTIARAACGLGSLYADADDDKRNEIFAKLMEHAERLGDGDPSEIKQNRTTAENQWRKGAESPASRPDNSEAGNAIGSNTKEPSEFMNLTQLMGYQARYNLEKYRNEWFMPDQISGESIWRPLSKDEVAWMFGRIWDEYGWNIRSSEDKRILLSHVCKQIQARPTRDWLKSCKVNPALSDITLDNWMNPWLTNSDGELEQWASRALPIQIVSRIHGDLKPQRIIIALRGPGNCGKSAFVQNLLPENLDATGSLNIDASDRDITAQLTKSYVVEQDEMHGSNKKSASSQKSLIGAGYKKLRELYSENAIKRPYSASIIATTNLDPVLYDDEALISRYVFVDFERNENCDPARYILEIREHIFALAYRAYLDGFESNILPVDLGSRQRENAEMSINSDRLLNDSWIEITWRIVPKRFRSPEIAAYMGLARNPEQYRRLKLYMTIPKLLRNKGFVSKKGKSNSEWWERPANSTDEYPMPDNDISQSNMKERRKRMNKAYDERNNPISFSTMNVSDNLDDL